MIKLFKGLTFLYFLSIFLLLVFDVFLIEILGLDNGVIVFFLTAILYLLIFRTIFKAANKRFLKIGEYMSNCQLGKYIKEVNKLSKSRKSLNDLLAVNLSSAYIGIGDTKKAFEILDKVPLFFSDKSNVLYMQAVVYNNLFAAYFQIGEIDRAKDALNKMKCYIDNPKLGEPYRSQAVKAYIDKKFRLNMEYGNFEGAYEHFKIALDTETTLLGKVNYHYYLALIFLHTNNLNSAREHLYFVAENGGDTHCCVLAKEKLAELESKVSNS